MTMLWGDTETYSETPIKNGVYRYAEGVEVMLFTYALDDGEVQLWDRTTSQPMPSDLKAALEDQKVLLTFHKADFDRTVLRLGANIAPDPRRFRCTLAQALAHSLPGSLDKLCTILKVPVDKAKFKDGKALVQLFCKPRPKGHKLRRATRETHPEEWERFCEYAKQDIEAIRAIAKMLPKWNYRGRELALWHLDQQINDRGIQIDLELANAAVETVARERKRLAAETKAMTDDEVTATTQRNRLLAYILERYGVTLPDMQADTLERRIEDPDLPEPVKELLRNRLQASSTSVAKYKRLLSAVSKDGALRGLLQFCGAMRTGRWAGRLFQPQNLPRCPKHLKKLLDLGIDCVKALGADLVFDNVMELCVALIRGVLVARPGKKLIASDLSNIEGRGGAWLAGEQWKLQAFRAYDAGTGPDLYKLAYAKSFATTPDTVDDYQRQIGKVMELMLQYQGGVGAFVTGAETYGIDLEELADKAIGTIPCDVMEEAEGFLAWLYGPEEKRFRNRKEEKIDTWTAREYLEAGKAKARLGLSERVFLVCDSLKRLWRRQHPMIVAMWGDLENAARQAILSPGNTYPCQSLRLDRVGNWLRIRLPSGRYLCYPGPEVDDKGKISYMGVHQYTRQWQRISTYGGKLFENVTQGFARDVMAEHMPDIELHGYDILLTVHDEIIAEAPDTEDYTVAELSALLSRVPAWAPGIPLAAGGFEGYRYRKD